MAAGGVCLQIWVAFNKSRHLDQHGEASMQSCESFIERLEDMCAIRTKKNHLAF